jgi:hypothetical protein
MAEPTQADLNNHANQLNKNNSEFWHGRNAGHDAPDDAEFEWIPDFD